MQLKLWYLPCSHLEGKNNKHCTARPGAEVSAHLECPLPRQVPVQTQRGGGPSFSFRTSHSRGAVLTNPPFSQDTHTPGSSWPRLLHSVSLFSAVTHHIPSKRFLNAHSVPGTARSCQAGTSRHDPAILAKRAMQKALRPDGHRTFLVLAPLPSTYFLARVSISLLS